MIKFTCFFTFVVTKFTFFELSYALRYDTANILTLTNFLQGARPLHVMQERLRELRLVELHALAHNSWA